MGRSPLFYGGDTIQRSTATGADRLRPDRTNTELHQPELAAAWPPVRRPPRTAPLASPTGPWPTSPPRRRAPLPTWPCRFRGLLTFQWDARETPPKTNRQLNLAWRPGCANTGQPHFLLRHGVQGRKPPEAAQQDEGTGWASPTVPLADGLRGREGEHLATPSVTTSVRASIRVHVP